MLSAKAVARSLNEQNPDRGIETLFLPSERFAVLWLE